jgi:hypothetical protein
LVKVENIQRIERKDCKKIEDAACEACRTTRKKPSQVKVKVRGEIDGGCDRKNQWDDSVHTLAPWMLDVSIIHYDEQDFDKLAKLKLALDNAYAYLQNELSNKGFKNAIKRFVRGERNS